MQLDQLLSALGIEDCREVFEPHWEEDVVSLPENPSLLDPDTIRVSRDWVGLPEEHEPLILATAEQIRQCPALKLFAWHCHECLFRHQDYPAEKVRQWPSLERILGEERCGILYLLVALGVVPLATAFHQERGVPEDISRASCGRFEALTEYYAFHNKGNLGAYTRTMHWLRHYVNGDLFRVGRMEYMVRPFRGGLTAYRHRDTREVIALAADGTRFAADGMLDMRPAEDPDPEGWVAHVEEGEDTVTGCPISPAGVGLREPVTLDLSKWKQVLTGGDPVLDVHIPGGGNMTPEACRDTMERAMAFFREYFPERPFVGFACGSWILNPEIADFYRPDSNMILWQKELYLFPIPTGRRSGLYFVFYDEDPDLSTAPRETSLQRAVLKHLEAGGRFIVEGMFFLAEDMDKFGTQFYLSHFPPSDLDAGRAAARNP